jgi:hypothetical protein
VADFDLVLLDLAVEVAVCVLSVRRRMLVEKCEERVAEKDLKST